MSARVMLSDNFALAEFLSKEDPSKPGAVELANLKALAQELERVRRHAGRPLVITSGYRSPAHNHKIGGANGSVHTQGLAADIAVKDFDEGLKLAAFASTLLAVGGVGLYASKRIIHIDIRKVAGNSRPVWWYQDEKGVYGAILQAHKVILRRWGAGGLA